MKEYINLPEVKNKKAQVSKICFLFIVFCSFILCIDSYAQEKYPKRIISLAPSITEQLYLLGVEEILVANTIFCEKPENAKKKEKIGTVLDVDIEKLISLKPDLILASPLLNYAKKEKIKMLGIRLVTFPSAKSFNDVCKQFIELGKLVGKEKEAREIINKSKEEVLFIKNKIRGIPKPKVIVQIGAKPLWVASKNSYINDLVEFAGGINVGPSGEYGLLSREDVIRSNPDVIIISTMGIIGEDEKRAWQRYKSINAVKNNRIYIMDSDKLCEPTPVSFIEALKEIVKILHPNLRRRTIKDINI